MFGFAAALPEPGAALPAGDAGPLVADAGLLVTFPCEVQAASATATMVDMAKTRGIFTLAASRCWILRQFEECQDWIRLIGGP